MKALCAAPPRPFPTPCGYAGDTCIGPGLGVGQDTLGARGLAWRANSGANVLQVSPML